MVTKRNTKIMTALRTHLISCRVDYTCFAPLQARSSFRDISLVGMSVGTFSRGLFDDRLNRTHVKNVTLLDIPLRPRDVTLVEKKKKSSDTSVPPPTSDVTLAKNGLFPN
jgi:hypothetical protein